MKKFLMVLTLAVLGFGASFAQAQSGTAFFFNGDNDQKAITCTKTAAVQVAAGATGVVVPLAPGKKIVICGFLLTADTVASTATLSYGTGTTCGTGNVALSGGIRFADELGHNLQAPAGTALIYVPIAKDFCVAAATGAVSGTLFYGLFPVIGQ